MSRKLVPIDTHKRAAWLLLQSRPDGVKAEELATVLEVSIKRVRYIVQVMTDEGLCVSVGATHTHRYAAPQFADSAAAVVAAERRQKRKEQRKRSDTKKRQRKQAMKLLGVSAEEAGEVLRQIRTKAEQAKPLKKLGPASVFELGAMG